MFSDQTKDKTGIMEKRTDHTRKSRGTDKAPSTNKLSFTTFFLSIEISHVNTYAATAIPRKENEDTRKASK